MTTVALDTQQWQSSAGVTKISSRIATAINTLNPLGYAPSALKGNDGNLYTAYKKGSAVCVGVSTNGGLSWTEYTSAVNLSYVHFAIDSTGKVHIVGTSATTFGQMSYMTFTAGTFSSEAVLHQETVGSFGVGTLSAPFIAIDTNDIPHVTWAWQFNTANGYDVHYKNRVGGSWGHLASFLPSAFFSQYYAQLVFDNAGKLYLFWVDDGGGSHDLYFAYSNDGGTTWTGQYPSLNTSPATRVDSLYATVDSSNNIHIVYIGSAFDANPGRLYYRKYTGSWSGATTLKTGVNNSASIVIDRADVPHVFFQITGGTAAQPVCHMSYSGSWSAVDQVIDDAVTEVGSRTPVYPKSGGVSSSIPPVMYYLTYIFDSDFYYYPVTTALIDLESDSWSFTLYVPTPMTARTDRWYSVPYVPTVVTIETDSWDISLSGIYKLIWLREHVGLRATLLMARPYIQKLGLIRGVNKDTGTGLGKKGEKG